MADETVNNTMTGKTQGSDPSAAPESEGSGSLTLDPSDKSGPRSSSPESGGSTQGEGAATEPSPSSGKEGERHGQAKPGHGPHKPEGDDGPPGSH